MNDLKSRCPWCLSSELYMNYHDNEWGIPVYDDQKLFEFLLLETFQAGLSWITILKKREYFRVAFDDFDYHKIANYKQDKIESLLEDSGIIRNKLKVHSAVSNALAFMKVQHEFGSFSKYIWSFSEEKILANNPNSMHEVKASTPFSDSISKDLKKRGFKFVGPTVVYAYLQAIGVINDHITSCWKSNI